MDRLPELLELSSAICALREEDPERYGRIWDDLRRMLWRVRASHVVDPEYQCRCPRCGWSASCERPVDDSADELISGPSYAEVSK